MQRLGLGLAALGRPAYINMGRADALPFSRSPEQLCKATWGVLDAAYAAGIRWVDAARSYGRAEEFLGGWLGARSPQDLTVSSKWGYAYVGEWRVDAPVHEVKEHSLNRYRAQYEESRTLLGDHLDVYQVHSLTADSPLFEDVPLQEAIAEAAASGIRVGFSTSGPAQPDTIRRALDLEVSGQRLFSTVQSTWNVFEQSAGEALQEAHEQGLHVLLKEVLANGKLAVRPPTLMRRLAFEHRVRPDAVAIAAALAQPWADTVLVGAVSPHQLQSNLAAARVVLGRKDLPKVESLAMPPARYWSDRAALPWT